MTDVLLKDQSTFVICRLPWSS